VSFSLDVAWLSAFLLAMVRATAWVFVAPPFASKGVPTQVKLGLAMSFAVCVAPSFKVTAGSDALADSWGFIAAVLYQAAIGLAMGFGVLLLLSAVQAAGALIDLSAGFSAAQIYDPLSNASSTPFGRFYQLLTTTILFATGGHVVIVRGFLTSFAVAGEGDGMAIEQVGRILAHNLATFFAAALQMAVPLMAAMFVAEIGIGMVAKAVPQMNIISVSFGVKMGAALGLGGLAIRILPAALFPLVQQAADTMQALGR
jgi:flagellar biosynthetic protein FliR